MAKNIWSEILYLKVSSGLIPPKNLRFFSVFLIGLQNISLRPLNVIDLKEKGHRLMNYSQCTHLKTATFAILLLFHVALTCMCSMRDCVKTTGI